MFAVTQKQQDDIISGKCPISVDSRILRIPILEQEEEMINIDEQNHDLVQMLPMPEIPLTGADFNAGFACSMKVRKSVWDRLIALANNLAIRFGFKVRIYVFEALRDMNTQLKIYETFQAETESEKQNIIANPRDVQYHPYATGANVSIRPYNLEVNEFIDFGKFGMLWGPNPTAITFSANLTDIQKKNRQHLLISAEISGLVNYPYEWWHFSFGDRYFCYYTGNKMAVHGMM